MVGSCGSGLGTPGGSGSSWVAAGVRGARLGWVGRSWGLEAGLGRGWVTAGLQLGCVGARLELEGRGWGIREGCPELMCGGTTGWGRDLRCLPGSGCAPTGTRDPGRTTRAAGLTWRSGRGRAARRGEGAATGSRAAVGPALRPPPSCSMPSRSPAPRPAHWCWGGPRGPRSPPPGLCAPRPERGRSPARTREGIPRRHPRPAPLPDPQEKTDWSAGPGTP